MYDLLTSHGDLDDLILFADNVRDHERVILLYLEREDYERALATLEPLVRRLFSLSPNLLLVSRITVSFSTSTRRH